MGRGLLRLLWLIIANQSACDNRYYLDTKKGELARLNFDEIETNPGETDENQTIYNDDAEYETDMTDIKHW